MLGDAVNVPGVSSRGGGRGYGIPRLDLSIGGWRNICTRRLQAQKTPMEMESIWDFAEGLEKREVGCYGGHGGTTAFNDGGTGR